MLEPFIVLSIIVGTCFTAVIVSSVAFSVELNKPKEDQNPNNFIIFGVAISSLSITGIFCSAILLYNVIKFATA